MLWNDLAPTLNRIGQAPDDADAWEALYRKLYPYLIAIFYREFRGDRHQAEDAAHETMIRLFRSFRFDHPKPERVLPSYIARVIQTIAADQRREVGRRGSTVPVDEVELVDHGISIAEREELRAMTASIMENLKREDQALLGMLIKGYDVPEIATRLKISRDLVYKRLSRLRQHLRDLRAN